MSRTVDNTMSHSSIVLVIEYMDGVVHYYHVGPNQEYESWKVTTTGSVSCLVLKVKMHETPRRVIPLMGVRAYKVHVVTVEGGVTP